MAEAEKLGIPAWALRKAKVRERVCSGRRGFGPGGRVMWGYTREEDPAAGYASVFETFESVPAPQPPRCAWDGCEEEPRSPRAFYCAAHARQSREESKRAWKQRHGALVREAMARLEARGKGRGADGGDPPTVALLEPLAAAREWLESPDPQAALQGVRANLDILERLLDRGHGAPRNSGRTVMEAGIGAPFPFAGAPNTRGTPRNLLIVRPSDVGPGRKE